MLSVEHKKQIKYLSLFLSELSVRTQCRQYHLRSRMCRYQRVHEQAFTVITAFLYLISRNHDVRQFRDYRDSRSHFILRRTVLRIIVIRVKSQNCSRHFIHDVL